MANFNLTVNGVNVRPQHLVKLDNGVTQEQAMDAAADNGMDEMMLYNQETGEAFMAYGQGMDFSGLDGYQPGDRVHATLDGAQVAIVPFVANANGQAVQLIFDDEINTAGDGASTALSTAGTIGKSVLGMAKDNALQVLGAGVTLGAFARMGGAKIGSAAAQETLKGAAEQIGRAAATQGGKAASQTVGHAASQAIAEAGAAGGRTFLTKAGDFVFGPAKGLTGSAVKGLGKMAKWTAIIGGAAAVVGVGGTAIYGASRSGDATAIESLGKKVH